MRPIGGYLAACREKEKAVQETEAAGFGRKRICSGKKPQNYPKLQLRKKQKKTATPHNQINSGLSLAATITIGWIAFLNHQKALAVEDEIRQNNELRHDNELQSNKLADGKCGWPQDNQRFWRKCQPRRGAFAMGFSLSLGGLRPQVHPSFPQVDDSPANMRWPQLSKRMAEMVSGTSCF